MPGDQGPGRSSWWRRASPDLVLLAVIFVVGCVSPTPQVGDSRLSVVTAWQLVTHLNLHLEGYRTVTGLTDHYDIVRHDGHLLPYFPWPTMLFMIPADLLYALSGHNPGLLSISDPNHTWILEVPTASLLVAITALLVRRAVLNLGKPWGTPRTSVLAALVFGFATSAWSIGSRALWQQTVSMLCLMVVLLLLQRLLKGAGWRVSLGLGAVLAVAVITRPTNAPLALLALIVVAWRRPRRLFEALGGGAAVMAVFAWCSSTQYGTWLPPYYQPGRLGEPGPLSLPDALAANLVSPGRGLLLFDPILLLAVVGLVMTVRARQLSELDGFMALSVVALWLTISDYGSTGGATYGPRLMLDIVPYLVVLSAPTLAAALDAVLPPSRSPRPSTARTLLGAGALVLLVWGLFVNATGGLLRSGFCWSAEPVPIDNQPSRVWDWSDPQFLAPYEDLDHGAGLRAVVTGSCGPLKPYSSAALRGARSGVGRLDAREVADGGDDLAGRTLPEKPQEVEGDPLGDGRHAR